MLNCWAVLSPVQLIVMFVWKSNETSAPRPLRSVLLPLVGVPFSPALNAATAPVPGPIMARASIEATANQPSFLMPKSPPGRERSRVYIDRVP